jgi:hypothetical protein
MFKFKNLFKSENRSDLKSIPFKIWSNPKTIEIQNLFHLKYVQIQKNQLKNVQIQKSVQIWKPFIFEIYSIQNLFKYETVQIQNLFHLKFVQIWNLFQLKNYQIHKSVQIWKPFRFEIYSIQNLLKFKFVYTWKLFESKIVHNFLKSNK